jgi:hypothetical protein
MIEPTWTLFAYHCEARVSRFDIVIDMFAAFHCLKVEDFFNIIEWGGGVE